MTIKLFQGMEWKLLISLRLQFDGFLEFSFLHKKIDLVIFVNYVRAKFKRGITG